MRDCRTCGFPHTSEDEAEAMHDATESVHSWFKERVLLSLVPVQVGAIRKAEKSEAETRNPVAWTKRRKEVE